ncbi:MAG: NAD(P)H-quinone oxidoreductase [Planctomycetes bacterium]|nr:NAD(P)H-quinone oxidoreductase [Planctomycetota bacterium]
MIQMEIGAFGEPDALRPARVAIPRPGAGEILIRVMAAGINRPDILQRQGKYPAPAGASPVPGLEVAGEVIEYGERVGEFHPGDHVCALTNGGGYAEYCVVPEGQALPWPAGFDAVQAASLPETYFTVWANLFQMGRIRRGESVLVHGGSSGIGVTALQLASAFGVRTFATAGSAQKCSAIERFGTVAINYREQDFAEVVNRETAGRGVDAILDMVGASYWDRNLASLAFDGRLLLIAFLGGAIVERADLRKIMTRRLVVTGSAMRPRTSGEKATIARELRNQVWPLLSAGTIRPIVHATFPLSQVADAHRLMESSQHIGKIVLRVSTSECAVQ